MLNLNRSEFGVLFFGLLFTIAVIVGFSLSLHLDDLNSELKAELQEAKVELQGARVERERAQEEARESQAAAGYCFSDNSALGEFLDECNIEKHCLRDEIFPVALRERPPEEALHLCLYKALGPVGPYVDPKAWDALVPHLGPKEWKVIFQLEEINAR